MCTESLQLFAARSCLVFPVFFFFSSRRRHTRCSRDWSSDVCSSDLCSYPEINDVGLTALTRTLNGHPEVGFSLRVGGGLSSEPYFALRLNAFVRWDQVVPVVQGVAEIFRDADGLRENRERARLKYLFMRHGWTAESFQAELERRIGFRLDPAVREAPPSDGYRDHVGEPETDAP